MNIEFARLIDVEKSRIIELMNNQRIKKHMPLINESFSERDCDEFLTSKEQLWKEYGYGPWAFMVDEEFAGWGGVQPENSEADLALVLHPNFWGIGKAIYHKIIHIAFNELNLPSVTALFPPTRTRVKGLLSLGFIQDGILIIREKEFIRYRLKNTERDTNKS